jgi:flagellar P-ring protein precursor FlgI
MAGARAQQALLMTMIRTRVLVATAIVTLAGSAAAPQDAGTARLKDIAAVQGPPATPLIGYGLVAGLNKTGDRRQSLVSAQTLANLLERFGIDNVGDLRIENVAAVLVTANLPPYAHAGSRLDVTVSSIGDARSLQGGTLLPTPLRAPDGRVVAFAQGPLSIGGFGAGGGGNTVQVNHLTVGRIPQGAQVSVAPAALPAPAGATLRLALYDPDFVTAGRVARAIEAELGPGAARVVDAGSIEVSVPEEYQRAVPALIARIEPLPVAVDTVARVAINERTGTVVLGGDVRIGPAAVAHGNLSVRISTRYAVSQPQPFSQGTTVTVPDTQIAVDEGDARLVTLDGGATLADVVGALNRLGATPRDIIAIMQALKAAGALRAEIILL